jgi:hypothetical protein
VPLKILAKLPINLGKHRPSRPAANPLRSLPLMENAAARRESANRVLVQAIPSLRPLQPKKTRASHNLSPAWGINWARREGGRVLNVGHMQMTNSSTLEDSCLAPSVAGSARLSTASWRRPQPTMRAYWGAHPARCFATVSDNVAWSLPPEEPRTDQCPDRRR